jgi:hypothetical protein
VPIAMVTFVDRDRVWLKSLTGLSGLTQVDRRASLCAWWVADWTGNNQHRVYRASTIHPVCPLLAAHDG